MRALITGASGFIGSRLARALADRDHRVRCLVRARSNLDALDGVEVECARGDVTASESLAEAVRGVDVVFHLAGIRRSPTPADFERVHVEGTRNLLSAVEAAAGTPPRMVLASSLAAMGPSSPDRPHREDDAPRPVEWYGESKARAETVCREFASRVPIAILRPPRVVGPGDRENLAFFRIVRRDFRLRIGGGPRPLSMVDVDDVVRAFLVAAEHPAAVGEAFFVAAEEATTLEGVQDLVARSLGITPRELPLAPGLLRALAAAADGVSRLTGRHLPLNRKLAGQLLAPAWTCSAEKARRVLGFRAEVGLAESIDRSAKWYCEHGWL